METRTTSPISDEVKPLIAYFSMEIAVESAMPTYAGGLGVLAGDTVRAAADLKIPMIAVTLLHRKGYFSQMLDASGWQHEGPVEWPIEQFLEEQPQRTSITILGRTIYLRAWKHEVRGITGSSVPIVFIDSDLPENSDWDRTLTHFLYGGDRLYRLCQEIILGIGGVRMLKAMGYHDVARFHMNEGHASLLTLELLDEAAKQAGRTCANGEDIETVRRKCIFTTHTPVPAGHDQFPMELVARVVGPREDFVDLKDTFCVDLVRHVIGNRKEFSNMKEAFQSGSSLNLTYLALNLSHYVNGVAKKHGETSRLMFAGYKIDAITNGVHATTWTSPPFQELFDRYIAGWRADNLSLRYAHAIPLAEIWTAHLAAKKQLIERVNHRSSAGMDPNSLTLGFARRATAYKRADLLFQDVGRLKHIADSTGSTQIVFAGKAHPDDRPGKELIQRICQLQETLKPAIKLVYLENYDMELAKLMTSGVDVWLNTPLPPLEASGTSGMKAALNGVPSLSVLDGWWIEGCIDGQTGWSIGDGNSLNSPEAECTRHDATSLYDKLEHVVLPLYYRERDKFTDVMRHAISLNGSFFNTHRMMQQYVLKAYFE